MPSDIPTDDKEYAKLAQKVMLRMLRSLDHYAEQREKWARLERWWDQIELAASAGDEEGAVRLGYAFGLVERMHAKTTEPLFQMGLPYAVRPRRLEHVRSAKNQEYVAQSWYSSPNVQEALSKSKKLMTIVGHRWEFDYWKHVVRKGKRWGTVPREVSVPLRGDGTPDAAAAEKAAKMTTEVLSEVPFDRTVHYGFDTEYPNWEDVHPEPYRTTVDTGARTDMAWVVRDLGFLALEDLAKEMTTDPTTKATVPLYDFSRLLRAAGKKAEERYDKIMRGESGAVDQYGTLIVPVRDLNYQGRSSADRGARDGYGSQTLEDRDKIWVVEHRENGEILYIAQGKYVIRRKLDPWHNPGLKVRIENYVTDPRRLHGKGAIEPLEAELGQLDDIHELGMQNIFRLVNKMVYVREDAIVSEDDFHPRAGGRVRIKADQSDVRAAVADASQASPIGEMISTESELKGLIEWVSMELDGSPGVMGTKSEHKTARGQMQILRQMAPAFARWQRQARINECRRGMNMADFFAQFAFDRMSYRYYRPDGSTAYAELDRTDTDTGGVGFDFTYDMDPLWGSLDQKRELRLEVFKEAKDYAMLPPAVRGENSRLPNLDELMEDIFKASGYSDVSTIFRAPDGQRSPEDELNLLAQGGTEVECKGDLMHHATTHRLQAASPWLAGAIAAGKAEPKTKERLLMLAVQCESKLKKFLQDPEHAAAERLRKAGALPAPKEIA